MWSRRTAAIAAILPVSGAFAVRAALTFDPAPEHVALPASEERDSLSGNTIALPPDPVPTDSVVSRNIFQPDRKNLPAANASPAHQQRDRLNGLRLRGTIVGARPAALLDGIPEYYTPRLLEIGDTLSGFHVIAVDDSSATVTFATDSIRLPLRDPNR